MTILKVASMAVGLFALSSTLAFADSNFWEPNVSAMGAYSGYPFIVSGGGRMVYVNDTDEAQPYTYSLEIYSDCGPTLRRQGYYHSDVVIAPHTTWDEHREITGELKCQHPGQRQISIAWTMTSKNNPALTFSKTFFGYAAVLPG